MGQKMRKRSIRARGGFRGHLVASNTSYLHKPVSSPLIETMDHGSAAFASAWRAYIRQWTQPQFLKLTATYFGAKVLHSSTMVGFGTRALRRPAPQTLAAVGYLNVAHAWSLNITPAHIDSVEEIGLPQKLPDTLRGFWEGREPLSDADRVVLGPAGVFEAFCGFRALLASGDRCIPPEQETEASDALARHLRLTLSTHGTDWYAELPHYRTENPAMAELLMGKVLPGAQLLKQLPQMSRITGIPEEHLWGAIESHLAS